MVPHPESERKGNVEGVKRWALALHFIYVGANSFAFYECADFVNTYPLCSFQMKIHELM